MAMASKQPHPRFVGRGTKAPGKLYSKTEFTESLREITTDLGLEKDEDWYLYDGDRRAEFPASDTLDSEALRERVEECPQLYTLVIH